MTRVHCDIHTCLYCEKGVCRRKNIWFIELTCSQEEPYSGQKEYQEEYWIACRPLDKPTREKLIGKRIVVDGMVFFTCDDDRYPDNCRMTEEITGIEVGTMTKLQKGSLDYARYILMQQPPVMSLPEK